MALPAANLEDLKNATDVASNLATVGAIVLGGIWAYWRYLRERTRWPRAALSLHLTERHLDDSNRLFAVKLRVSNEGRGLMKLTELRFDLHRVRPIAPEVRSKIESKSLYGENGVEADWPLIEQHTRTWSKDDRPELEPEESDEYCTDFFVDPSEQTVFLYAYLENEKKKRGSRKLGWTATAFYDLEQLSKRGLLVSLISGGNS